MDIVVILAFVVWTLILTFLIGMIFTVPIIFINAVLEAFGVQKRIPEWVGFLVALVILFRACQKFEGIM
jgi:hypothetical protein